MTALALQLLGDCWARPIAASARCQHHSQVLERLPPQAQVSSVVRQSWLLLLAFALEPELDPSL